MFCKSLACLRYLDIFGFNVLFYINQDTKAKSKFGGLATLTIFSLCVYFFANNMQTWKDNKQAQIFASKKSTSVTELVQKNQSLVYNFDSTNYNIYFFLRATYQNGTSLNYEELEKYIQQDIVYKNALAIEEPMLFSKCLTKNKQKFLFQPYDENNTSTSWGTCFNQSFPMGLISDVSNQQVNATEVKYQIRVCQNSTSNNFSCPSLEIINDILNHIDIQVSLPQTQFDFNDPQNPKRRTYDYRHYSLSYFSTQFFTSYIITTSLQTDNGFFSENYESDSLDFNTESIDYQTMTRGDLNDNLLFQFKFRLGYNNAIYNRKNPKIFQILASLGGILNLLLLLGGIICRFYNSLVLKYHLINNSFENLEDRSRVLNEQILEGKNSPHKKNFEFSFFSLLCPRIMGRKAYDDALNEIYEYLDINSLITKLQDVDKLKMILLDANQRFVFDNLPKPGIEGNSKTNSNLTMYSIKKTKFKENHQKPGNYAFLLNGDPVNARILDLLDRQIKEELKNIDGNVGLIEDGSSKREIFLDLTRKFRRSIGLGVEMNRWSQKTESKEGLVVSQIEVKTINE